MARVRLAISIVVGTCSLVLLSAPPTNALNPLPNPDPKPGSYGLEAIKKKPAPAQGATITTPGNGASFTSSPVAVNGICPDGLLVQVLNNGVMVGSVMCENGSFSIEVSLFAGTNELSAMVYDEIDQSGPVSNTVTVTYTDTRFTAFGALITLTSAYGRRSAAAETQLTWPLQLSGGTGPYAFSIDWGDGGSLELKSQPLSGIVSIAHVYKKAGIYRVNIKASDVNGVSAFLQVIALSNGQVEANTETATATPEARVTVLWVPAALAFALLLPAFWLGRRSQLVTLRKKMLRERDNYQKSL